MVTYTYKYNRIIHYFKITRPISKETHPNSEWHHIIPISCNGSDSKENLVLLPTRWHYIVHCWLPGVYLEKGDQKGYEKMLFAWNRMQNSYKDFDNSLKNIKIMSLMYEKLRFEYKQIVGKHTSCSGNKNSQYGKHWWKDPNDKTKSMSIKDGDPVPEGWVRGRWYDEKFYKKTSISVKGRKWFYNPTTKESKFIRVDEKEMQNLLMAGWIQGREKHQIYTSNGIDKLILSLEDKIPAGYVSLKQWKKDHLDSKTLEEINIRKRTAAINAGKSSHERYLKNLKENFNKWREMYLWYLDHNEDFESMKKHFGYERGKDRFLQIIRKYHSDIYKYDKRGGKPNSRPKIRGPYKKKNPNNL